MYKLEELKLKQGYPNRFRTRQWIKALEKRIRKKMKYWDEGNGRITDDPSYAPIVDGGEIYIETYELRTGMWIDIAYSQETKQLENMYYYRQRVLAEHNLKLNDIERLVRLAVPSEKYKEIMEDNEE